MVATDKYLLMSLALRVFLGGRAPCAKQKKLYRRSEQSGVQAAMKQYLEMEFAQADVLSSAVI